VLINLEKLDTNRSYICLEIGTSEIARIIQKVQKKKFKKYKTNEIASHVFILYYKNGQWYVWENHLMWNGIKEYTLTEYEEINKDKSQKKIEVYEYHINNDACEYWLKNNPGYSVTNLFCVASERLVGLKMPDTKGWICSQSGAACNFEICNNLGISFDDICPVDFQEFFKKTCKSNINVI
jgi:hypothetical protein